MVTYYAHSGLRYLVLLLGAAALLYALFGLITKRPYDRPMQVLGMSFAGALHLQVLLGFLVLFIVVGRDFHPGIAGHVLMMLMAVAAVQIPLSVMKRRPLEARTFLPLVVGIGIGLLFIVGGILSIGRGVFGSATG